MHRPLDTPIRYIKGAGPKVAGLFGKLGIETVLDLIYFLPRGYEDRTQILPIADLLPEAHAVIKAEIGEIELPKFRSKNSVLKVTLTDSSGSITAVWFNQLFLVKLFRRGMNLIVSGRVEINPYDGTLQFSVRNFEIDTGANPQIVPIYPLTEGLYLKKIRSLASKVFEEYLALLPDVLPKEIKQNYQLCGLGEAIRNLHFPKQMADISKYQRRLIFDDFFFFQLGLGLRRKAVKNELGIRFDPDTDKFAVPFELTTAQKRVIEEIKADMRKPAPMNRLIQGDVGSGKTIVAAIAAHIAISNGYQVALMAPTEILASQHFQKLSVLLKDFNVKLLTGTTQRKENLSDLDQADIAIGTHALIEEKIRFRNLGLVIVDEQHRFGVLQRAKLAQKGASPAKSGASPDILFLTATPIPRSLALTLYGDLDCSIIDEMPPGRMPVKTHYVPDKKRPGAYDFVRKEIKAGRQAFVVCPLVEESEKIDLKAAMDEAEKLQKRIFPEFKVGLLHGRMKGAEKDQIMDSFKNREIDILVSTTVIEVGIDIPNAAIMLVEQAERFGLSQLHQLRGRIGRGSAQAYCFLFSSASSAEAKTRIKAMIDSSDGFYIAEVDLKLRGPGDFAGLRQSGLPNFHIADILRDEKILKQAREAAFQLIQSDPRLEREENQALKREIAARYGKFLGY